MTGTIHSAELPASGQRRIEGFDPARDKLDLGGNSVHAFIVVDTAEGVAFMDPWSGARTLVAGVALGQLTVDSFLPVENDHLRQDVSGALAWEHGVAAAAHTVYARSHEVGRIDRVAFDPGRDVVDFRYYGTREQIYLVDGAEGAIIGNYTTGQALVLLSVAVAELSAENFLFHHAQAREDRLFLQLGFDGMPDAQVIGREDIPTVGTTAWPAAAGPGAPPGGVAGTVFAITWDYGAKVVLDFDPAVDRLDFRYLRPAEFSVAEVDGAVVIAIVGQNQSYTLAGVGLGDLDYNNVIAVEDATFQLWRGLIDGARGGVPVVSVADARVAEGDGGERAMRFAVSLSRPASGEVTVDYATLNGTAVAGGDYRAALGTVRFAPGETSAVVEVPVLGDAAFEFDERFELVLSAPVGARLGQARAEGTIENDDAAAGGLPAVSVADLAVAEGDGAHVHFMFPVTLDRASAETVTVAYRTVDGTARAGADYVAASGVVSFAPGQTAQQIHVDVIGDRVAEADERFGLVLSDPAGVVLGRETATGTLLDDDAAASAPGGDAVAFEVKDDWGAGFVAQVTLRPGAGLDGWTVAFDAGFAISNVWNAEIVSREGGRYVLRNAAWNGTVAEGGEVSFGFQASPGGGSAVATGFAVNGRAVGAPEHEHEHEHEPEPEPVLPVLSVADVAVAEGDGGTVGAAAGFLATSGNQIVDADGRAVKIAGVNWFGFESSNAAPHGIWARSLTGMMDQMKALGFNTIRLPFASDTLRAASASGIDYAQNPELRGLTPLEIMDRVVAYAGEIGLRVILDHHRSSFGAGTSENGLWYDAAHPESQWIEDWRMLAARYAGNPAVIGADLHNEPYNGTWGGGGARDWAAAAERAGNAILAVNPDWLIFVEGVGSHAGANYWWGGNLMGVRERPVVLDVPGRLVYSAHDYGNSVYPQPWFQGEDFAAGLPAVFEAAWGYIFREGIAPVLVGEFGTKLVDPKDGPWLEALTAYMGGDFDLDGTPDLAPGQEGISWTYWSWNPNSGDTGGILADDWRTVQAAKMAYLAPIQAGLLAEGGGGAAANEAVFTVRLSAPAAQAVTVAYRTEGATAGAGDFTAASGTLTFAPGETTRIVRVAVTGDRAAEADETFSLVLEDARGAVLGDGRAVATILDDDAAVVAPLPVLSVAAAQAVEGSAAAPGAVTFAVLLSRAAPGPVRVRYATADGTAASGRDYVAQTGTLDFAAGETARTVTVALAGDAVAEGEEGFALVLNTPEGATLGTGRAAGTIRDDDAPSPPGGDAVTFRVRDDWGAGFVGQMTLRPAAGLAGWTVAFDAGFAISNIWGAEIVSREAGQYVVRNAAWNAEVGAGREVTFGFQASPGGGAATAGGFMVNGRAAVWEAAAWRADALAAALSEEVAQGAMPASMAAADPGGPGEMAQGHVPAEAAMGGAAGSDPWPPELLHPHWEV